MRDLSILTGAVTARHEMTHESRIVVPRNNQFKVERGMATGKNRQLLRFGDHFLDSIISCF
jgi:hypothetical protein